MAPSTIEPELTAHLSLNKTEATAVLQQSVHEEHQYLDLIREILADGEHRPDRYD